MEGALYSILILYTNHLLFDQLILFSFLHVRIILNERGEDATKNPREDNESFFKKKIKNKKNKYIFDGLLPKCTSMFIALFVDVE